MVDYFLSEIPIELNSFTTYPPHALLDYEIEKGVITWRSSERLYQDCQGLVFEIGHDKVISVTLQEPSSDKLVTTILTVHNLPTAILTIRTRKSDYEPVIL